MLAKIQLNKVNFVVSFIIAMSLKILPLPPYLSLFNPDWVLLALIYWTLAIPEKIGVFTAWVIGIFVDVLTGRFLGQQALAYAIISYICLKLHKRLRQYPVLQQSLFIFLCLLFSQMLMFWIENIYSVTEFSWAFWLPVFIGTMFWPVIYSTLRFVRIFGHNG
jgi:rod shape-determining protein MreD